MSRYRIEVELFKGDYSIDFPENLDGDNFHDSIKNAKVMLDIGLADEVVIYISRKNELLEIITESKGTFETKDIATKIKEIKERYGN